MKSTPKPTPAVAYVRMSSGKQEASPDQQREEIAKLAKRHNCRVLREYYDEAISGDATDKRKAFQQMIRDAEEKGDFAAILCWDQDRFGRFDSIEAGRWIYPLRQAGVWLITVAQGQIDWNDFAGRMVYSIQQEGKHQFLIDLSKNVLRGKVASARQGRGASVPPCGYDRAFYDPSGQLVRRVRYGEKFTKPAGWTMRFVLSEDAELVATVRWIFDTFANTDCGVNWIVESLNRRGSKTAAGKTWSVQTVRNMLSNPVYTGASRFGDRRQGKYHHLGQDGEITRGDGHNAKGEPIIVEGIHEAMIDRGTFDRIQAKLAERGESGRKPRYSRYILSGLLRCGHCGGAMAGKGYNGKNVPRYYCCTTGATRPGACRRYQVPQEKIEEYVSAAVEKLIFSSDAAERVKAAIHRRMKARQGFKERADDIRSKIEAMDRKIAKGSENLLLADRDALPELSKLLASWRKERDALQERLERAAEAPDGRTAEEATERAVAQLERLRANLRSGRPTLVRATLRAMITEITLWWQPTGSRRHSVANGVIRFANSLEFIASGTRTASATSSDRGTPTGQP